MNQDPAGAARLRDQNYASLADVGLKAVLSLWREDTQSFQRSSIDDPGMLRPTVTFRCVEILLDTTATQPERMRADPTMLESAAAHIVNLDPATVLAASELAYGPFTFALWTLPTARIPVGTTTSAPAARRRAPELLKELRSMLPPSELHR